MLRELRITNLAIIEELLIDFTDGLVVFTGETGTGKSIIMQALYLLTGIRAATSWIRQGADAAAVEALFEYDPLSQEVADLRTRGFESDGTVVIRRILAREGRSRFYINGSPANAKTVEQIAGNLLSIASQHEHQLLLAAANHLLILDDVGGLDPVREVYSKAYLHYQDLVKEYEQLGAREREKEQRRDFLDYQVREITAAKITHGEDDTLAEEKVRLKAADDLRRLGGEALEDLNTLVLDHLRLANRNLARMADHDRAAQPLAGDLTALTYQLEDFCLRLQEYLEAISDDPARLDAVAQRLHLLGGLKRKYGDTLAEIQTHCQQAQEELDQIEKMEQSLAATGRHLDQARREVLTAAAELSTARQAVARKLEKQMARELQSLNFEGARLAVHFHDNGGLNPKALLPTGVDRPEFLFSANPGEPVLPMAKVASGGELSRLMLGLKCILAQKDRVKTVIFDEVDSGISGKAAAMVAAKIHELAGHHQVLCITHLPQIAAQADEHYQVSKIVRDGRTITTIDKLIQENRVTELARMLDGEAVTGQTMAYARELLGRKTKELPS